MAEAKIKRVTIEQQDGVCVYSAGWWPGWNEVVMLCVGYSIIAGLLAGILYGIYRIQGIYEAFFTDILNTPWLYTVFSFIFAAAIDLSFIAGLAILCLWIPYFLIYQLSPKRFWIKDQTLYHTAHLLGFIPQKRKIPFENILNVEAAESNRRHAVSVLYERTLPKWVFVILVFWNEKLTQWPLMLVNGIPTMEEAKQLQMTLLEPMTQSGKMKTGGKKSASARSALQKA